MMQNHTMTAEDKSFQINNGLSVFAEEAGKCFSLTQNLIGKTLMQTYMLFFRFVRIIRPSGITTVFQRRR